MTHPQQQLIAVVEEMKAAATRDSGEVYSVLTYFAQRLEAALSAGAVPQPTQDEQGLAFIRSEAARTAGKGPLGELWAAVLVEAERLHVDRALARAVAVTKPLCDKELQAEQIPTGFMEMRLRAGAVPQQEPPVNVQLLAWAVTNCHMLARRALARTSSAFDREKWEHVLRVCEKAGARSSGVLRASLPTEITDGSGDVEPPQLSQNEQAWEDLRADGGLPESHPVAGAVPALPAPQEQD